jgi:sulfur relay (sulfurtransferase) complex TusBCD TusD component (DsrE family)
MNLGVVITEQSLVTDACRALQAAAERGWHLRCFLTDSGVHALHELTLQRLAADGKTWLAVCELSVERYSVEVPKNIAEHVVIGGQYQDAELAHLSDRVVVF